MQHLVHLALAVQGAHVAVRVVGRRHQLEDPGAGSTDLLCDGLQLLAITRLLAALGFLSFQMVQDAFAEVPSLPWASGGQKAVRIAGWGGASVRGARCNRSNGWSTL